MSSHRSGAALVVLVAVVGGGGASALSCFPSARFACQEDAQCVIGEAVGRCEETNYCSYPDDACASGHRYHEHAPSDLAGECVSPAEDTSTSVAESTATSGSTSVTSSTGTDESSSTEPPLPVCGDGVVEDPERCDDGDTLDDDMCNRNCQPAGELLWLDSPPRPGDDSASAVRAMSDGGAVVAAEVAGDTSVDLWLRRYTADGDEVWTTVHNRPGDGDETVGDVVLAGEQIVFAGSSGGQALLLSFDDQGDPGDALEADADGPTHWSAGVADAQGRLFVTGRVDAQPGDDPRATTHCYELSGFVPCGTVEAAGAGTTAPERGAAIGFVGDELVVAGNVDPAAGDPADAFIQRLTPALSEIDLTIEPGLDGHAWRALAAGSDGFYVAGSVNELGALRQIRLRRFDTMGAGQEEVVLDRGASATDIASGIAVDSLGNVIAVGDLDQDTDGPARPYEIWVAKYDASLDEIWTRTLPGDDERGWAVALTTDDEIFVVGEQSVDGNRDILVAKFSP